MGADDSLPSVGPGGNLGDAHHRCVGSQDGIGGADAVQVLEELLLQLHVLGEAFDDKLSVPGRLRQVCGGLYPAYGWFDCALQTQPPVCHHGKVSPDALQGLG
ncbi:hypothetical protein ES703_37524 [subsurface metagenome]